jgi:hypothetical protein
MLGVRRRTGTTGPSVIFPLNVSARAGGPQALLARLTRRILTTRNGVLET